MGAEPLCVKGFAALATAVAGTQPAEIAIYRPHNEQQAQGITHEDKGGEGEEKVEDGQDGDREHHIKYKLHEPQLAEGIVGRGQKEE